MGHAYRDAIASYIHSRYGAVELEVYTEVALGKTIIGKDRQIDIFVLRSSDSRALGLECKWQSSSGTTDEKIPYALQDLRAMWIPGCLVYAGTGWSSGVLHTLQGSRNAVYCNPDEKNTVELDHVLAAVFGLWTRVIPASRRFRPDAQLPLLPAPLARVGVSPPPARQAQRKTGDKAPK